MHHVEKCVRELVEFDDFTECVFTKWKLHVFSTAFTVPSTIPVRNDLNVSFSIHRAGLTEGAILLRFAYQHLEDE